MPMRASDFDLVFSHSYKFILLQEIVVRLRVLSARLIAPFSATPGQSATIRQHMNATNVENILKHSRKSFQFETTVIVKTLLFSKPCWCWWTWMSKQYRRKWAGLGLAAPTEWTERASVLMLLFNKQTIPPNTADNERNVQPIKAHRWRGTADNERNVQPIKAYRLRWTADNERNVQPITAYK